MRNKFWIALLIFLITPLIAWTSSSGKVVDLDYLPNLLSNILLISGAVVVIAIIAFLLRFNFMLMNLHKKRLYQQQGLAIPEETVKEPLWDRLYSWATDMVPVEKEADVMLDHNYDGIRELDNSLPPWWVAMFYICILIGGAYMAYYHYFDMGVLSGEEYAVEMEAAEKAKEAYLERQANAVNESNVMPLVDQQSITAGQNIFKGKCAVCHGQLGEGGVGPNLVDEYWIHGGDIKAIFKTVKYGVPEKGMIAWKSQLRPADIHTVSSFILTLRGTNPPNQKDPQGIPVLINNDSTSQKIGLK